MAARSAATEWHQTPPPCPTANDGAGGEPCRDGFGDSYEREESSSDWEHVGSRTGRVLTVPRTSNPRPTSAGAPSTPPLHGSLYKTSLCRYYASLAGCKRGGRCTFAHGRHELRGHGQLQGGHMQPVASRTPGNYGEQQAGSAGEPGLFKMRLCRHWQHGACSHGDSCGFAHGAEELQVPQARHPRGACLQWEHHGSCWYGDACRYLHERYDETYVEEVPKEEEEQQQQQGHGDEMRSQASSPAPWQQHQHGGASEEEEEKDSLAAVLHHLLPPSVTNEAAGQQGDSGSDAAATPATHNAEAGSSGGGGDGRGVGPDLLALLRRRLPSLLCPLTGQAFADPVVAADECVYERAAIERSLYQEGHDTSPVTHVPLQHKMLMPCPVMRRCTDEVLALVAALRAQTASPRSPLAGAEPGAAPPPFALYKTSICRFHNTSQGCKFGERCSFAHGAHELRRSGGSAWASPPASPAATPDTPGRADSLPSARGDRPELFKTQLCHYWAEGTCSRGDRCSFAHGEGELRSLPPTPPSGACWQWASEGSCRFGAACRFLHGQPREQQHGAAPLHINQVPREPQELPAAVPAPAAQHHTEPPLPGRALPSAPPPPPERQHSDAASDDLSMAALLRNMLPGSEQHGTAGQEGGSDTVEGTPTPPAGGSQPGMEGAAATSASHAAGGAAHTVDTRAAHEAEGSAARAGGPAVPGMVGSAALSSVEGSSGGGTAVEPDLMVLLQRRLPSLLCPLTGQAFADPVVAADGCVYERAAIESYLYQEGHDTSPVMHAPLQHKMLMPCPVMRRCTDEVLALVAALPAGLIWALQRLRGGRADHEAAAPAPADQDEGEEVDVELPAAPKVLQLPFPEPASLKAVLLDVTVPLSLAALWLALFSNSASLFEDFHRHLGDLDVAVSGWRQKEGGKRRVLRYTTPLRNPLGPRQARNTEVVEAGHLGAFGFFLRARCASEGVPFAAAFANHVQWVATAEGPHTCRLVVTGECHFHSPVWGPLKGQIERESVKGMAKAYRTLLRLLERQYGAAETAPAGSSRGSSSTQAAAAAQRGKLGGRPLAVGADGTAAGQAAAAAAAGGGGEGLNVSALLQNPQTNAAAFLAIVVVMVLIWRLAFLQQSFLLQAARGVASAVRR
ncbi:GRAM domain-containing 1B-like [Micractinium conductrix]|uniref:GRAM domain-containing 1B-like n=1 Tax=Micractinium conductrix TaxID=554055 RepID=A0A2P6V4Q3_9CHLO|nr:GRAM domain-containing 1B-like [Micractinium conductrix]|eukprot:PSC69072.1 GRAM domain-containing 1B-like [Micractinium conductrix]